jgi:hypothetical protein
MPDVTSINWNTMTATLEDGSIGRITCMMDHEGDETEDFEDVSVIIIEQSLGLFAVVALGDIETVH